jgi:diaminohydroxyphosphoribosylaminopyrimidine deaminase/5-amino-6-(5-phosphoribosylamino)uracil reductase
VVVDSRLETPPDAQLFQPQRPVWIYGAIPDGKRAEALEGRGARLCYLPGTAPGTQAKVDLRAVLRRLWPGRA